MRGVFGFILLASAAALVIVFTAQYGFHMEPCVLCEYQRIVYWAAGGIALVALTVPTAARPGVANLLGVLFLCGAGLAFYHTGVEQHWWHAATSCAAGEGGANMPLSFEAFSASPLKPLVKSCDDLDWTIFGLSITVYNTVAQIVLALAAFGAGRPLEDGMNPTHRARRFGRLPGDPSREDMVARIVRVDQAGEYGAKRIYAGQLAVLGHSADAQPIRDMAAKEDEHLAAFDRMMVERRVRPTVLQPLWHVAGFALGAASAFLGRDAAMACTVAVEEVIEEHYAAQAALLGDEEPELKAKILKFRDDELEHRDTGLAEGAARAPAYPVLSAAVKAGSRLAIWLSERV